MNLVDSINRLFLKRLRRSRTHLSVVGGRLAVDDLAIPLPSLAGAVAYNADVYAGEVAALALSFGDGRTYTVTQEDACWDDLVAALDRLKLTASPSSDWLTALFADDQNTQPMILRGKRRGNPTLGRPAGLAGLATTLPDVPEKS